MREEIEDKRCELSDEELVMACNEWVSKLASTGGKAWTLQVPVNFKRDPDMLFIELGRRLLAKSQPIEDNKGWISVEDKTPAKFKKVLVFTKNKKKVITCIDASGTFDKYPIGEEDKVTHWQEITEPPIKPKNNG